MYEFAHNNLRWTGGDRRLSKRFLVTRHSLQETLSKGRQNDVLSRVELEHVSLLYAKYFNSLPKADRMSEKDFISKAELEYAQRGKKFLADRMSGKSTELKISLQEFRKKKLRRNSYAKCFSSPPKAFSQKLSYKYARRGKKFLADRMSGKGAELRAELEYACKNDFTQKCLSSFPEEGCCEACTECPKRMF